MAVSVYANCDHIKRTLPSQVESDAVRKAIGEEFNILPLYEKYTYEHKQKKHYSLTSNELLKCRWAIFKENYISRQRTPIHLYDLRDVHFYNGDCRIRPDQSIHKRSDYRFQLKTGPGLDHVGDISTAQDLFMERGGKMRKEL